MNTWKLTVEYDGSRYSGWQEQKNARTVAGQIRDAAQDLLGCEVELHGSGRTDAGVHALAQIAHLRAEVKGPKHPGELIRGINSRVPADIVILDAERVPNSFHARHNATARAYLYQISTRKTAFQKRYVWWVKEHLNVEKMQSAASLLAGRHDFICFRALDPSRPGESTVVVVDSAGIEVEDDIIVFRIEASHFIWRMVRRIVGVLVKLGAGEVSLAEFESLLAGQCGPQLDVAAWTAPASGLFLEYVRYPAELSQHWK